MLRVLSQNTEKTVNKEQNTNSGMYFEIKGHKLTLFYAVSSSKHSLVLVKPTIGLVIE